MNLGLVPYGEAFELQRSLAGAVSQGAIPETVIFLEHPPVVTIGRRTETESELHIPEGAAVEIAETDRGGKSTFHGPGQLVCYPILDLHEHGKDVKRYVRDLEQALIRTLAAFGLEGVRYDGLTGVWMAPSSGQGPRKIASIGVHVSRWVTTHGYALNVDLDPAPFTEWITACGLEDAQFTTMARELERPLGVDEVRPEAIRSDRRGLRARARGASGGRRRRALAAVDPRRARGAMTVDVRPFPRLGWDPLPGDGVVGVMGRVLGTRGRLLRRPASVLRACDDPRAPGREGHDRRLHRRKRIHVRRGRDSRRSTRASRRAGRGTSRTGCGRRARP